MKNSLYLALKLFLVIVLVSLLSLLYREYTRYTRAPGQKVLLGPIAAVTAPPGSSRGLELLSTTADDGPTGNVYPLPCPLPIVVKTFERRYTGNYGNGAKQAADCNYFVVGSINYPNYDDALLIKLDQEGNLKWQKIFSYGTNRDRAFDLALTNDGGVIIVGVTWTPPIGQYDILVIKTDRDGNQEWMKTFGGSAGDVGYSVIQTLDGGYAITGLFDDDWVGLIKLKSDGQLQWSRILTWGEGGYAVRQTKDGGYILTGSRIYWGNDYALLIKTDPEGNLKWAQYYSGSGNVARSVEQTPDEGFIVTGHTNEIYILGTGYVGDLWVFKTDKSGVIQWQQIFGDTEDDDFGYSVQPLSSGGYIITGLTNYIPLQSPSNVWLIKLDDYGNKLWERIFVDGAGSYSVGHSIQQTKDGGYLIGGGIGGGGTQGVYVIKTDKNGGV